jgi:SpoVK/Ycf46/Vps4 family AAA+-type ATPase
VYLNGIDMKDELVFHLRALSRFIYVVTDEEDRFLLRLKTIVKKFLPRTFVFNQALGMQPLENLTRDWKTRAHQTNEGCINIHDFITTIYKDDPKDQQNFYVVTDPEQFLQDWVVVRRFLNLAHQLHNDEHNVKIIIFVSNRRVIPSKLAPYMQVIEDKGLSNEEIADYLSKPCEALKFPIPDNHGDMFRGFTSFEIEASVAQSVVKATEDPKLPQDQIIPEHIHEFRRAQLKKTDLVQYIDMNDTTSADVGGVSRYKEWAREMRAVWSKEGREYGLEAPRGVLLAGVWGTGKSISAKMLGSEWRLPIIQLEMGRLRASGVGDTEQNTHRVLRIVEAAAPCILWIDEAEKSLSGGQSSAMSDSGTTSRTLGIFSTWLQETKAPVSLVLTANTLKTLPVEFVNRMDKRFFFDLPNEEERIEILKIHLRKRSQNPDDFNLSALAEAAVDMVGREIEQCIKEALVHSFHAKKRRLDQDILRDVLRRKSRIVKTMVDEVKELTDWVGFDRDVNDGIRAHFASEPDREQGCFKIVKSE